MTEQLPHKPQNEPGAMIYQLRIDIAGAKPPLWRRVLVSADSALADLHPIIQVLMGWDDDHLHQFEVPVKIAPGEDFDPHTGLIRRDYRMLGPVNAPDGSPLDWVDDDWLEDEALAVLKDIAPTEKSRFSYIYDMGDNWHHDIRVEKILPAAPDGLYPICLTGKRNGPIEDCGGIWGYEALLEILADPTHEEFRERREWLQAVYGVSTWDGAAFDLEEINQKLRELAQNAGNAQTARRKSPPPYRAEIEAILADCYDEYEANAAWETAFTDEVTVPFPATLLGMPVEAQGFRISERSEILQCQVQREGKQRWVSLEDLDEASLPPDCLRLMTVYNAWLTGEY